MIPFPFSGARRVTVSLVSIFLFVVTTSLAQNSATPAPAGSKTASVIIVVDNSRNSRFALDTLRKNATQLAQQFSSSHELALYFAGDKPTLAQDFTGDASLVINKLKRVPAKGKLALFETLSEAVEHARSDAVNEQSAVIAFVNDINKALGPSAATLESSIRSKPGVQVFLIALKEANWKSQEAVQKIAVLSGGSAYFPQKNSEIGSITRSLATRLGGSPETESESASEHSLAEYSTVLVRGIPVADNGSTSQFDGADGQLLQRVLVSRLRRAKLFADVRDGSGDPSLANTGSTSSSEQPGAELELLPMVVSYKQPGKKQRQFYSPFAGGSRLKLQVVLRDRATQQPVAAFVEEASGSQGWFSGSDERNQAEAMMRISNKVVDRLREMKKRAKQQEKEKNKHDRRVDVASE